MHIEGISFGHLGIFSRKWHSHSASSPHLSSAINLDFIMDLVITICFEDFHETVTPPSITHNHYMILSLTFDIQFTSL